MSKFMQTYYVDLQAYDDTGSHFEISDLENQYRDIEKTNIAIENAFTQLGRAQSLKKKIQESSTFNKLEYQLSIFAMEQITINCGLLPINKKPALEATQDYKAAALEGFTEIIGNIIEAIKRAFKYIWDLLSKFFSWLFSSARRNKMESDLESLEERVKKSEKAPTKIKPSEMEYFPNIDILKGLDYGVKSINRNTLLELLSRIEKFYNSLNKLTQSFNLGVNGFSGIYKNFVSTADKVALSKFSGTPEKFDFINFKKEFYNSIHSTVDVTIDEQYNKANILKEQNYVEGLREKSKNDKGENAADPISFVEGFAEGSIRSRIISEMRISEVLGGLSKLYFIMYSGENENYVPVNSKQIALSLIEENSSRYLAPEDLLNVLSKLKDVQHDVYLKQLDIETKLNNARKVYTEMLKHLSNLRELNKQAVMEPETADSYEKTVNIIFIYLQRQQRFLTQGIYKGIFMVETNMNTFYKFFKEHDSVYRTI
jgi:hypothetical protein